jgi:hypothetical protein
MNEKGFRLDFAIGLSALIVSLVAAGAAVYQTRVIAQQFSATVWPYVSFDRTDSPWSSELDIRNDGLGPAIVRSVAITWDGKNEPTIEAVLSAAVAAEPQGMRAARKALAAGTKLAFSTSTPTAGMVIPANSKHMIFRMDGALLVHYYRPALERVGLSFCYCSLTGSCWLQKYSGTGDSYPQSVGSCPHNG